MKILNFAHKIASMGAVGGLLWMLFCVLMK